MRQQLQWQLCVYPIAVTRWMKLMERSICSLIKKLCRRRGALHQRLAVALPPSAFLLDSEAEMLHSGHSGTIWELRQSAPRPHVILYKRAHQQSASQPNHGVGDFSSEKRLKSTYLTRLYQAVHHTVQLLLKKTACLVGEARREASIYCWHCIYQEPKLFPPSW